MIQAEKVIFLEMSYFTSPTTAFLARTVQICSAQRFSFLSDGNRSVCGI